jgi:hypothetical protein
MIMAHRKIQLYQLDECQSSTINKNRKRMRRRIVKKILSKISLLSVRERLLAHFASRQTKPKNAT